MNKEFSKKIKETLLKQKQELEEKLKGFAKVNPNDKDDYNANFPDYGSKEDENAQEVDEYGAMLSLEQTIEKNLRDVNVALVKIEKNEYGICKYCKKPINEKRLLARASSSACIKCKEKLLRS